MEWSVVQPDTPHNPPVVTRLVERREPIVRAGVAPVDHALHAALAQLLGLLALLRLLRLFGRSRYDVLHKDRTSYPLGSNCRLLGRLALLCLLRLLGRSKDGVLRKDRTS